MQLKIVCLPFLQDPLRCAHCRLAQVCLLAVRAPCLHQLQQGFGVGEVEAPTHQVEPGSWQREQVGSYTLEHLMCWLMVDERLNLP